MITITQGDTAILNLTAQNGAGAAVDLTGATFETTIKGATANVTFLNSQHAADPDQSANKGKFTLTLSISDTNSLKQAQNKEMVTKIVQGLTTIYYHGAGVLNVLVKTPTT